MLVLPGDELLRPPIRDGDFLQYKDVESVYKFVFIGRLRLHNKLVVEGMVPSIDVLFKMYEEQQQYS